MAVWSSGMRAEIFREGVQLFHGEARKLSCPGVSGVFEVLEGHTPFLALLREGVVVVEPREGESTTFSISQGTCAVSQGKALLVLR